MKLLLRALGKKSPVYKSIGYPGKKVRVTLRPESCVSEGWGWSKPLHTPSSLALLLLFQDPADQLDR